jgi:predicted nucleic-acid-binding protein
MAPENLKSGAFVDTDVLIRYIARDDATKQRAAATLFRSVESGAVTLRAPDTVITDAVFVLSSPKLHALPRMRIRTELATLLHYQQFKVHNRRLLLRALDIYAGTNLDFGDAMIAATMERRDEHELYSYDRDFDRLSSIRRREPEA